MTDKIRIGVAGTGFISKHFSLAIAEIEDYFVSAVLTRRDLSTRPDHPAADAITRDLDAFLDGCDVVFECSGDPLHAADVVAAAFDRSLPVVTMNAEFHVTSGSDFVGKGLLTEAEGDQPGSEAALAREAVEMGFRPLVYGNIKGFLNHDPTPSEMEYWGNLQGISLPMVTSFTDGTKVQVEQALVANGFGATIARQGLIGLAEDDLRASAEILGARTREIGQPIAEFVLSPQYNHGVFIVAEHDEAQAAALEYLKQGPGPYYTLIRPSIFAHLEIMKTIRGLVEDGKVLLDNSTMPEVSVAAIAKSEVEPGTRVAHAIGSFDFRGEAVRIVDAPDHVPIGLIQDAEIVRPLERGQIVTANDVVLPDSRAAIGWAAVKERVLSQEAKAVS